LLNPNEKDCGLPDSKKPSIRKKYGFPKTARLLKKSDFEATFKVGAKGVSKALVIYVNFKERSGLEPPWSRSKQEKRQCRKTKPDQEADQSGFPHREIYSSPGI